MTIFSFIRKIGISLAAVISLSIAVPATAQATGEKMRFFP